MDWRGQVRDGVLMGSRFGGWVDGEVPEKADEGWKTATRVSYRSFWRKPLITRGGWGTRDVFCQWF
jgi:hypothetical protein